MPDTSTSLTRPTILPVNPVVPLNNRVAFTTYASGQPHWRVVDYTGSAHVDIVDASEATCQVTVRDGDKSALGSMVLLTDGLGHNTTLYIVHEGIPGALAANTIAYDQAAATLYFKTYYGGQEITGLFERVALENAPGGIPEMCSLSLPSYAVMPPPGVLGDPFSVQYCTCILVNLNALTGITGNT